MNCNVKAFVIEDVPYINKMLTKLITNIGCEVIGSSTDVHDALIKIENLKDTVNLITLDLVMPKISGMEMIPKLLDINPDFKIIIISSSNEEKTVVQALVAGAKHYILKPITKKGVHQVLKKVMG